MSSIFNLLKNNIKFLCFINIILFALFLIRASNDSIPSSKEIVAEISPLQERIREITKCENKDFILEIIENDKYYIVKNYIRSIRHFQCHESITFTTHGDFKFLDNLVPLLKRWRAPLTIALYTPGYDLITSLNLIFLLRNCDSDKDLIREFVSFSIFFDKTDSNVNDVLKLYEMTEAALNCTNSDEFMKNILNIPRSETYKSKKNLSYPINVARNLARDAATTHFIFPCDIELFPNPNFIDEFFKMLVNDKEGKLVTDRNVFVFAVFEIELNEVMPDTKQDVVKLYNDQKLFWFHHKICPHCHDMPGSDEWLADKDYDNMKIIATTKRQEKYYHWEPFYVGTNIEPYFEERIHYENSSDKMTQAYIMCIQDYNFNVLSNGFLIHKNGIKTIDQANQTYLKGYEEGKKYIKDVIVPEIHQKYGQRKGCRMY